MTILYKTVCILNHIVWEKKMLMGKVLHFQTGKIDKHCNNTYIYLISILDKFL